MSIITDLAKAHYDGLRGELKGPILVPEWGEENSPLKIYYKIMNLAEQDIILKHIRDNSLKALVQTIITRSLDGDGVKLFRTVELTELYKHADADVIERICNEMSGEEEDEEPIKN